MILLRILGFICLCAPLFVFFDYNKRSNIQYAIIYVVVFAITCIFVIYPLIKQFGLYFAGSIPVLMVIFLFLARKSKGFSPGKKTNTTVIDDF